jgi:NAD(P)H-hydrate epimerase
MGIEEPYDQIKDFFKNIIQNSEKCIIIDADVVVMLSHFRDILLERKNKQVTLVLLMNRSETEKYFNELMPQDEIVKKEAISHNAWFVLKGTKTRIFSPDGHINELQTNNLPQMANAGAGDVLSGLIGGFIGRGIPIHKSIMDGINIRKKAAEYYLKTTQDITALPQDIIRSIPFVISSCDENK